MTEKQIKQADVIIACDFSSKEEVLQFLAKFGEERPFVKIGMELFYREGPDIVRLLKQRGHRIFLDLKLHDIPNTVYRAMKNIAQLGVDMTNVHAAGTIVMMQEAKRAIVESGNQTLLLAVTQLTSTSEDVMHEELWIARSMEETVQQYALNTQKAGLDGVVCSPLEASLVAQACGAAFVTVTPGIRFADGESGDQVRVTTPARAKEIGSHYIVVGRPVTGAADPLAAYLRCRKEFLG